MCSIVLALIVSCSLANEVHKTTLLPVLNEIVTVASISGYLPYCVTLLLWHLSQHPLKTILVSVKKKLSQSHPNLDERVEQSLHCVSS